MWCFLMGVVIGALVLLSILGVCDCVQLLIVCCDVPDMMGDVLSVCGCGDFFV